MCHGWTLDLVLTVFSKLVGHRVQNIDMDNRVVRTIQKNRKASNFAIRKYGIYSS